MSPAHTESPSNRLCKACGMCCDGTLFARATSDPSDNLESYAKHGLVRIELNGKKWFKLPCPVFNGVCGIYAERFDICRSFKCRLLKDTESGQKSVDVAMQEIANALKLSQKLRDVCSSLGQSDKDTDLPTLSQKALELIPSQNDPLERRKLYGRLVLISAAWYEMMHRSFYKEPKSASEGSAKSPPSAEADSAAPAPVGN